MGVPAVAVSLFFVFAGFDLASGGPHTPHHSFCTDTTKPSTVLSWCILGGCQGRIDNMSYWSTDCRARDDCRKVHINRYGLMNLVRCYHRFSSLLCHTPLLPNVAGEAILEGFKYPAPGTYPYYRDDGNSACGPGACYPDDGYDEWSRRLEEQGIDYQRSTKSPACAKQLSTTTTTTTTEASVEEDEGGVSEEVFAEAFRSSNALESDSYGGEYQARVQKAAVSSAEAKIVAAMDELKLVIGNATGEQKTQIRVALQGVSQTLDDASETAVEACSTKLEDEVAKLRTSMADTNTAMADLTEGVNGHKQAIEAKPECLTYNQVYNFARDAGSLKTLAESAVVDALVTPVSQLLSVSLDLTRDYVGQACGNAPIFAKRVDLMSKVADLSSDSSGLKLSLEEVIARSRASASQAEDGSGDGAALERSKRLVETDASGAESDEADSCSTDAMASCWPSVADLIDASLRQSARLAWLEEEAHKNRVFTREAARNSLRMIARTSVMHVKALKEGGVSEEALIEFIANLKKLESVYGGWAEEENELPRAQHLTNHNNRPQSDQASTDHQDASSENPTASPPVNRSSKDRAVLYLSDVPVVALSIVVAVLVLVLMCCAFLRIEFTWPGRRGGHTVNRFPRVDDQPDPWSTPTPDRRSRKRRNQRGSSQDESIEMDERRSESTPFSVAPNKAGAAAAAAGDSSDGRTGQQQQQQRGEPTKEAQDESGGVSSN